LPTLQQVYLATMHDQLLDEFNEVHEEASKIQTWKLI